MQKNLLFLIIFGVAFLEFQTTKAQSPSFNHTTVFVVNLQQSTEFYEKVMELEKIQEPYPRCAASQGLRSTLCKKVGRLHLWKFFLTSNKKS